MIGYNLEFTCDQGEEIGRFRPGILPAAGLALIAHRLTIGQGIGQVAMDRHIEGRHDIGAIGVVGDAAKALGLALGAKHAVRHIKARQFSIGAGVYLHFALPDERPIRHSAAQPRLSDHRGDGRAVDIGRQEGQIFPMQKEFGAAAVRVWPEFHRGAHPRGGGVQVKFKRDVIHQIGGRLVIFKVDRLRVFGSHGAAPNMGV